MTMDEGSERPLAGRVRGRLEAQPEVASFAARARLRTVGHYTVLALVVVAAILMRTIRIEEQSLWFDEGLTIVTSRWALHDMFVAPADPNPPLYFWLHKLFVPTDAPPWAMRSVALVAGVAGVGAAYLLGRTLIDRRAGLLAAALLAAWTAHVDYSQEARGYTLLFLFVLLATTGVAMAARALGEGAKRTERFGVALFCAGNVLAFYTHVVSVFWIAGTSLVLIWVYLRAQGFAGLLRLAGPFALMAALATPGLQRMVVQQDQGFGWLDQAPLLRAARTTVDVLGPMGLWTQHYGAHSSRRLLFALALPLLAAVLIWPRRREALARLRQNPAALPLAMAFLTIPVVVWLFGFVANPIFMPRSVLCIIPGALILIVALGGASPVVAAAAVAAFVLSTVNFGFVREKEDWRSAAAELHRLVTPGDLIVLCSSYGYPVLRYHAVGPTQATAVLYGRDGRFVRIEQGFGSTPLWAELYFEMMEALPAVKSGYRLTGNRGVTVSADTLSMAPGQEILLVAGHCFPENPSDAKLLRLLGAVDPAPELLWAEAGRVRARTRIKISRYVAERPHTLQVLTPALKSASCVTTASGRGAHC